MLPSTSRIQQGAGLSSLPGHSDSYPTEGDNRYLSSNSNRHFQRGSDGTKASDPSFSEGHDGSRPFYSCQMGESEKQHGTDPSSRSHDQDMEIGYEEDSLPSTLEGVEKKFFNDIVKLTNEQHDAEDAENTRHVEKLVEINKRYREKLSSLRARQATLREEFLGKESHARLQQHQYAIVAGMAYAAADARRAYGPGPFDSYREQFLGMGRSPDTQGRASYHAGQSYRC